MNKAIYILLFFWVSTLLCGCGSDSDQSTDSDDMDKNQPLQYVNTKMPIDDFTKWVVNKDNNLLKSKEISELSYKLGYLPTDYLAYIELNSEEYSKEKFEELKGHYKGMSYFNFRIELPEGSGELLKHDLTSASQYNERINYMSFQMQKDIFLIQGKDTILPDLFHFERIFEVAPYATVMIAFDNEKFKEQEKFTIVYNDHLFNKGYIKYYYRSKQLIDLPNITGV